MSLKLTSQITPSSQAMVYTIPHKKNKKIHEATAVY